MNGLFISFEGGEGVGKSTQADLLAERLRGEGRRVVRVREPGGAPLGERIRSWVKSEKKPLTPRAELLLFAASRAELVARVIRPELDSGAIVIADRYADSTTAYQRYGRGLPLSQVRAVNAIATEGLWPRLSLLLDMPIEESLRRVGQRAARDRQARPLKERTPRPSDEGARFETLNASFHQRVRDGYRRLAKADPARWASLDASRTIEAVHADIYELTRPLLPPAPKEQK